MDANLAEQPGQRDLSFFAAREPLPAWIIDAMRLLAVLTATPQ